MVIHKYLYTYILSYRIKSMGKITINIDDELEHDVRLKIVENRGKKGDLTKAIEAGLKLWLNQN